MIPEVNAQRTGLFAPNILLVDIMSTSRTADPICSVDSVNGMNFHLGSSTEPRECGVRTGSRANSGPPAAGARTGHPLSRSRCILELYIVAIETEH